MVQLSHPYMTTGKIIALTICSFVSKMMSLIFNTLSRFVTAFLPRSKNLLISWLQSPPAVILEAKKIKFVTVSIFPLSICHYVMGPDAMIFVFWMLSFKPAFSTLLFHLHQEALYFFFLFFKGSLVPLHFLPLEWYHPHAYLRLLMFLPPILIPACNSSSLAFLMMCSENRLNKQGDSRQPCHTPFSISCSIQDSNLLLLDPHTGFSGNRLGVWYSHLSKSFL